MSTVDTLLSYLLCLSLLLLTTAQENDGTELRLVRDYGGGPIDIAAMKETVTSLDDELENFQKRTCAFGLNSHHCALADLDKMMSSSEWLKSGLSPGKRSQQVIEDPTLIEKYERILEDVIRKRQHLAALKSMLQRVDYHLSNKEKRTCLLELGGQCRTELASAIADQYYYLNSPSSPGKRKRRSVSSVLRKAGR